MANAYPRESVEFMPVNVTHNGLAVTTGLEFAVVPDGERPVAYTPAANVGGNTGVMLSGFAQGTYRVFARVTTAQDIPVIDCGYFYIT